MRGVSSTIACTVTGNTVLHVVCWTPLDVQILGQLTEPLVIPDAIELVMPNLERS